MASPMSSITAVGFSFLLDGKFGNKIFSICRIVMLPHGQAEKHLPGRANGLTVHGVDQNGNPFTYHGAEPASGLNLSSYYDNYKNYTDCSCTTAVYKLRQVISLIIYR